MLLVFADRVMFPANPLMLLKRTLTVPVWPGGKMMDPGLMSSAKLVTVRSRVMV